MNDKLVNASHIYDASSDNVNSSKKTDCGNQFVDSAAELCVAHTLSLLRNSVVLQKKQLPVQSIIKDTEASVDSAQNQNNINSLIKADTISKNDVSSLMYFASRVDDQNKKMSTSGEETHSVNF